jgi:hypothetical protein
MTPTDFIRNMELKKALYKLHGEIIFHEVRCDLSTAHHVSARRAHGQYKNITTDALQKKGSQGQEFFPRFAPWLTQSFTDLDTHRYAPQVSDGSDCL